MLISLSVSLFCLFSFVFPCSTGCSLSLSISLYSEVLALLSLFVFCGARLELFFVSIVALVLVVAFCIFL